MRTLQERIRWATAQAGLTQTDLVRATKRTRAAVSDWFTGATKSLKGDTLLLAARALKVRPDWLSTGIGPAVDEQAPAAGELSDAEDALLQAWRGLTADQQEAIAAEVERIRSSNLRILAQFAPRDPAPPRGRPPLKPYPAPFGPAQTTPQATTPRRAKRAG